MIIFIVRHTYMPQINKLNLNVGFKIEICIQIKVCYVCLVKTHRQTKDKTFKNIPSMEPLITFYK